MTKEQLNNFLEEIYLEYFNNFLTIARVSEYYDIDTTLAHDMIIRGREIHHGRYELE